MSPPAVPGPFPARLPSPHLTFPEVFAQRAEGAPHEELLHLVRFVKGEPTSTPHPSGALLDAAKRAAAVLVGLGVRRGDRVLLTIGDPVAFLAFLLGAQCVGAVPVPCPSLGELQLKAYAERIAAVARDARPAAMVSDDARAVEMLPEAMRGTIALHDAESALPNGSTRVSDVFRPACTPSDTAFLQYTSGSTGSPRGVVVLHRNLTANLRAIVEGGEMGPRDVVFSWLPLFHDMGLVAGLLLGLYLGIPTYVASPRSFVTRPDSWLRAITRFRATFSAGPNFAFHALAHRVANRALSGLDLRSWRLAFDGAELVDAETFQGFVQRYREHGFQELSLRPAYGLAEATLAVAFPPVGTPARFDSIDPLCLAEQGVASPALPGASRSMRCTSVGRAVPGHEVRVVDPESGRIERERHVGEIVVVGPSVTPGYFNELSQGTAPRQELRTGDLGYLADGELYVVDRLKDVLVIAGRKYAPSDIECLVGALSFVRTGAVVALGLRGSLGTDELALIVALEPRNTETREELRNMIQSSVFEHYGLIPRQVLFVRPGDIPRTSSGKLRRSECRALLESGAPETNQTATARQ